MKYCKNFQFVQCDCEDNICKMRISMQSQHDPIVNSVISKFKQRSDVGIKKYGTTLAREDLTFDEWLNHAIEESMDLILYLTKIKEELKKRQGHDKHENMY